MIPIQDPSSKPGPAGLRLNLGCGGKKKAGWLNIDRAQPADSIVDLERLPWPWETGSVVEVEMIHVLEHLGQHPRMYIEILKELYRVCRDRARVLIVVPHPRHDHYLNDPTHVRPITPDGLALFSRRLNLEWRKGGFSNSTLALDHGVDFEILSTKEQVDPAWEPVRSSNYLEFERAKRGMNNVIAAYEITLEVRKDGHQANA